MCTTPHCSEALVLLPWRDNTYLGFPKRWLSYLCTFAAVIEDLPLLCGTVLYQSRSELKSDWLIVTCMIFSVVSIVTRVVYRSCNTYGEQRQQEDAAGTHV